MVDFGKFKYEQQKKKNEPRRSKNNRDQGNKSPSNIDENDYQVKLRAMKSFIEEGTKV